MQAESGPRQKLGQTVLFFTWASDPELCVVGLPAPSPTISTHPSTSKFWKTMGFLASMRPSFGFCCYRMTPAFYQRWVSKESPSYCLPLKEVRGQQDSLRCRGVGWWPFWSLLWFYWTLIHRKWWTPWYRNNRGYWFSECLLNAKQFICLSSLIICSNFIGVETESQIK